MHRVCYYFDMNNNITLQLVVQLHCSLIGIDGWNIFLTLQSVTTVLAQHSGKTVLTQLLPEFIPLYLILPCTLPKESFDAKARKRLYSVRPICSLTN